MLFSSYGETWTNVCFISILTKLLHNYRVFHANSEKFSLRIINSKHDQNDLNLYIDLKLNRIKSLLMNTDGKLIKLWLRSLTIDFFRTFLRKLLHNYPTIAKTYEPKLK